VLRIDRLSSAKPGNEASFCTVSHSSTASLPLGALAMTGPKKLGPPGGEKLSTGVPMFPPHRSSASAVSARTTLSYSVE